MRTDTTNPILGDYVPAREAVPVDRWRFVLDAATKQPTGYVRRVEYRRLQDILGDLEKYLKAHCPEEFGKLDYFDVSCCRRFNKGSRWPEDAGTWACWAHQGANEGYRVNIDIIDGGQVCRIFSGKTLYENAEGRRIAFTVAMHCAEALGV
jgi:hypothetical protein